MCILTHFYEPVLMYLVFNLIDGGCNLLLHVTRVVFLLSRRFGRNHSRELLWLHMTQRSVFIMKLWRFYFTLEPRGSQFRGILRLIKSLIVSEPGWIL